MALPEWPTSVPHIPLVGSWSMPSRFRAPVESEFDGGNARRRSKPGDDVPEIEFQIAMTRDEWETLSLWLQDECSLGSSRFIMDVWLGNGLEERIVGFAPGFVPGATEYGRYISVAMKLRVYGEVS